MTGFSSPLESPEFGSIAPYSAAGFRKFRRIIDQDGALPVTVKAIYVAAAAAAKGWNDICERELRRGKAVGLDARTASSGAIVLSSLRGEGPASNYLRALQAAFGPIDHSSESTPIEVQQGEAEANFQAYFGTIPDPLRVLLDILPDGADAYYLMRKGAIESNPLEKKYAELLLAAVLAADYSPMTSMHVKGARTAGATDSEIAEAIICAVPVAGVAAWIAGASELANKS